VTDIFRQMDGLDALQLMRSGVAVGKVFASKTADPSSPAPPCHPELVEGPRFSR